jgi:hypothetical protein
MISPPCFFLSLCNPQLFKLVGTIKSQIDGIVLDTLTQLNGVYVDLGYTRENTEKEFKSLVEETREFFKSKLLLTLALRGRDPFPHMPFIPSLYTRHMSPCNRHPNDNKQCT